MKFRRTFWIALVLPVIVAAGCVTPPAVPPALPAPPTSATVGGTTIMAIAPPAQACCHTTLPEFLGLKGLFGAIRKLGERLLNRLGMKFPGLESKPELLAITDPKNADSANPAVKAAAEAKGEEDAAPQKIKALRYLATLGCAGCYPDVQDALLAALDDCTESVRYEAVLALRNISGKPCCVCKTKACCSPKVLDKLKHIAEDKENNCYKESSARVRRLARLAMAGCGGNPPAKTGGPKEGPAEDAPPGVEKDKIAKPKVASAGNDDSIDDDQTELAAAEPSLKSVVKIARNEKRRGQPTPADPQTRTAKDEQNPSAGKPRLSENQRPAQAGKSGAVLAYVNGQAIYDADVAPQVERQLTIQSAGKATESRTDTQQRELAKAINRVLLCQAAEKNFGKVDLAGFQSAAGVSPSAAKIASIDLPDSLEQQQTLAENWLHQAAKCNESVTRQELVEYYQSHLAEFTHPDEIRIERLVAPWAAFADVEEARRAMAHLRARAMAQDSQAQPGTNYKAVQVDVLEWMRREDMPTPVAEQRLFNMPLGEFSPLLEDPSGIQTLRIIDRHTAGVVPLETVAGEIEHKLVAERRQAAERNYLERLRAAARIWTATAVNFDEKR